ncbi:MAG: tail fiber domain-containing protein, partial [Bacteroidetes bacterium]|nr:tail fiber domain-containing protein [Bacteroidota bacterium]
LQDHLRVTTGYFTITGGNKFFPTAMFGLGINTQTPTQMLDVNGGNINLKTPTFSYMINNQQFLWHKGGSTNVFLGVGAANNHAFLSSVGNIFIGNNSGFSNTGMSITSGSNIAIGTNAAYSFNSQNAVIIGSEAGYNLLSAPNVILIGKSAGRNTTAFGAANTFIGVETMLACTPGVGNSTTLGFRTGYNNTTGDEITFIGNLAGSNNTSGMRGTFVGIAAGRNNTTHTSNTAIGAEAGNTFNGDTNLVAGESSAFKGIGHSNVSLGQNSFYNATSGDFNTVIGGRAFYYAASGTKNTIIGYGADGTAAGSNLSNAAAIGYNARVTNNNHMILGNNNVNVGIGLSADPSGPQNKLEIFKGTLSNPLSGLRLRDLAGASPLPSNNQVLSINPANGDVILTNLSSGTSGLGNVCGASAQNPLTSSWEIPLANNNYIFSGQGTTNNNVGIGTNCTPAAKLEILQSSGNTGSTGLLVTNTDVSGGYSSNINAIGIKAVTSNNSNCFPIAGWFEAGNYNAVCRTMAIFIPQSKGIVSIGYSSPSIGMSSGTGILNVNGSADFSGTIYPSDISLKNTVTNISNSLQQIKRLRPITFKWNNVLDSGMAGTHAGFIAQEVDTVIPQLVKTNPNTGIKSLAYTEIIPYLVKGMQQQQRQIEKQDSIITALTNSITSCCSSSSARSTGYTGSNPRQYNIDLGNANTIVLSQNVPNPFAEQTTINYNVPTDFKTAQIIFNTTDGRILKVHSITTKGAGQLNVFANDLSSGMYSYYLIVDGNIIDTKKMVKN